MKFPAKSASLAEEERCCLFCYWSPCTIQRLDQKNNRNLFHQFCGNFAESPWELCGKSACELQSWRIKNAKLADSRAVEQNWSFLTSLEWQYNIYTRPSGRSQECFDFCIFINFQCWVQRRYTFIPTLGTEGPQWSLANLICLSLYMYLCISVQSSAVIFGDNLTGL